MYVINLHTYPGRKIFAVDVVIDNDCAIPSVGYDGIGGLRHPLPPPPLQNIAIPSFGIVLKESDKLFTLSEQMGAMLTLPRTQSLLRMVVAYVATPPSLSL